MRILVTGGAGFIASHIVDRYIELGHQVSIIDNFLTGRKTNIHPKATFYEADIRDQAKVAEIFSREKPEVVNHHAAQLDVRKSVADPKFDAEVNIIGFLNILSAAVGVSVKKIIFASSGGVVYGDANQIPTTEDYQPLNPLSPYGITKLASEYYLRFYKNVHSIETVALRYANIYGPRQDPHGEAGVVAIFTQKMLKNEPAVINGDGEQLRDYTFVGDVVRANEAVLGGRITGEYNIGTGIGTSVNDIFRTLQKLTGSTISESLGPAKLGEQQKCILNAALAAKTFDWKPQMSLVDGLAATVEFFKNEKN